MHVVYRNLNERDTLFGLDIMDILILGIGMMLLFKFNDGDGLVPKMINFIILGLIYLTLVYVKRHLPKGYIQSMLDFLFKPRIFLPEREEEFDLLEIDK